MITTLRKLVGCWLACSCILLATVSEAAEVSPEIAAVAVKRWLAADGAPLGEPLSPKVKDVDLYREDKGLPLYYVVSLNPAGFVILAADDTVEPVIAFAPRGKFDPSPENPLGALVGPDLRERMAQVPQFSLATTLRATQIRAQKKWKQLTQAGQAATSGSGIEQVSDLRVAPLVQSLWDQGSAGAFACYNYYTPPYEAGNLNNYPCGCVATAMAQLMRYHQHPTASVGTGPLQVFVNSAPMNRNLLGGDEAGGPYVWTSMPLALNTPTLEQCRAIGALTADAGVAVGMNYTASGSSAQTSDAKAALVNAFQYSQAVFGELNNPADLIAAINPNLDAHYPVLLGIGGLPGEHELICDGYGYSSSTLYHHLNLGWSGNANVWYALPDVDTGFYRFTYLSDCVYNIYPTGTGEIISGRILDSFGRPVARARVTAELANGSTYVAQSDTNGIYALAKVPSASQFDIKVLASGYELDTSRVITGTSADNSLSGNVWGKNFTLTTSTGAPVIMAQPTSNDVSWAAPAQFQVIAAGSPPLSYQWRKNGVDLVDSPETSGAKSSTLMVTAVSDTDIGDYRVVVANSFGSVTSAVASLTVERLAIGQPPANQSARGGQAIRFNANAEGAPPLIFQWYKDGVELVNAEGIAGATNRSLVLESVSALDAGNYLFVVTNAYGCLTSAVTMLTVADPFISRHPLSQVTDVGETATFSVAAGGSPPVSFQWRKNGTNLDGATSTSLALARVQPSDMGSYDLVVSNAFGSLTSSEATLTGNLAPADSFNSYADSYVNAFVEQPDGKILVGGYFASLNGQPSNGLGRLNADGSLDTTFSSPLDPDGYVTCLSLQRDGKILVGGSCSAQAGRKSYFVRLNPNGALDDTFLPTADFIVYSLVTQSDGKLLVGGGFTSLGGQPRKCLGRFNADGTLDTTFTSMANDAVFSILPQPDGKILVGGWFGSLNGTPRAHIGRLNQDGTLDTTFNPSGTDSWVYCMALQPDGKILVGGRFTTLCDQSRTFLGRLNSDGALDASFDPQLAGDMGNGSVKAVVLQANGKILIGGHFFAVGGQLRGNLARLNRDGSLDTSFNSAADWVVNGLAVQRDGKVLAGGMFSVLAGKSRVHLGRLYASQPATERLIFDGSAVTWLRDGTSPEAVYTAFEGSIDSGATWVPLGTGVPVPGGWQLAKNWAWDEFLLRARACVVHGSSWFIESVQSMVGPSPSAPTVQTEPATSVASTSATLHGYVTPSTGNATAFFEWGTTSGYGQSTPLQELGRAPQHILSDVSGLAPQTTYHYRIVAYSNGCTNKGTDITFATESLQVAVTIIWPPLSDLTYGEPVGPGQLNATANFDGTNVPGVFSYSPLTGTILNAGTGQVLNVTFTPDDLTHYLRTAAAICITVKKAPLAVAALNVSRVYGSSNPPFSAVISGFVKGDTEEAVSGSPTLSTAATSGSPVGQYTIETILGSLSGSNYCFPQLLSGWLTVEPAQLTVSAKDEARVFGISNPPLAGDVAGLQNGDKISATFSTTATPASPVGVYDIFPDLIDPDNKLKNYTVLINRGILTVRVSTPTLGMPRLADGCLSFEVKTAPGAQYILEYTESLLGEAWCPVGSISGAGAEMTLIDTNTISSARFYRLRVK